MNEHTIRTKKESDGWHVNTMIRTPGDNSYSDLLGNLTFVTNGEEIIKASLTLEEAKKLRKDLKAVVKALENPDDHIKEAFNTWPYYGEL